MKAVKVTPTNGYVFGREVITESAAITPGAVDDTRQRYVVESVSSYYINNNGDPVEVDQSIVGKTVLIQKHAAEGDTPSAMLSGGKALFLYTRIMAIED